MEIMTDAVQAKANIPEKAMMIAKAELADKLHGEMNKRTDLYITEIGSEDDLTKRIKKIIESNVW